MQTQDDLIELIHYAAMVGAAQAEHDTAKMQAGTERYGCEKYLTGRYTTDMVKRYIDSGMSFDNFLFAVTRDGNTDDYFINKHNLDTYYQRFLDQDTNS